MAGGGVLALPRALVRTGWTGIPILVLLSGAAAFNGKLLADCWTMLEARDAQTSGRRRNPYAIIAEQAFGKAMGAAVSLALLVTLFGAGVVSLLLAAQLAESLVMMLIPTITYCVWYIIVTAVVAPLVLFTTPKNFSYVGVVTFGAVLCACALYVAQMMTDIRPFVFRWGAHGFQEFFLAVATFMFNFSGVATFPTIQNDMTDKSKFTKSLMYSFIGVLILYVVIGSVGYGVYGENAGPNFATSLTAGPLTVAANVLMLLHLGTAAFVLLDPVCREAEQLYSTPADSLGWRIVVRGSVVAAVLFVGETIPRFFTVLGLVGGTGVALLTFVLPPACYLRLHSGSGGELGATLSQGMRVATWTSLIGGSVAGVLAAICAIGIVLGTGLVLPCYVK